ncbi:MAG: glycosyltransferase family 39 protein, partial [Candidatus Zixiibacteriota bacterium]
MRVLRDDRSGAVALAVVAVTLYLTARNAFYNFDALYYAERVELGTADSLLHPAHLLYNPVCWLAYAVAGLFGYGGRALGPMHVVDAVAGAAAVALMFLLCRRTGATRAMAFLAAAFLATAADFWANAAGVEVYAPAAASALAALYVAARRPEPEPKSAALGGVAFAAAALFHQLNLLLFPAALLYYLTAGGRRVTRVLAFVGGYAAVIAVAYVLMPVAFLKLTSFAAYCDWFFHFSRMNRWGAFAAGTIRDGVEAFRKAIYVNAFWDNVAVPFIKGDPRHLRVALPLWLVIVFGASNLGLWLWRGPGRRALLIFGVPFLLYAGFTIWWLPTYVSYWLVPAACLVGGVAVAASGRGRRWYVVSLAAFGLAWLGIANVNWRDGIRGRSDPQANADYRAGLALAALVPRDALVYVAPFPVMPHSRYFGGLTR